MQMKPVTYLTILLLTFVLSKTAKCAEFASWWQKTPQGNEICNEKWNSQYVKGIKCKDFRIRGEKYGHLITNLSRWYFYKKHIIGELSDKNQNGFFIFDESNCNHQLFKDKEEFESKLKALNLKPKIWTRWYDANWGMIITSGDFGSDLTFGFVILPILVIISIVVLIGLVRTRFNIRHNFNKVSLTIVGLILLRILLDILPGSI